ISSAPGRQCACQVGVKGCFLTAITVHLDIFGNTTLEKWLIVAEVCLHNLPVPTFGNALLISKFASDIDLNGSSIAIGTYVVMNGILYWSYCLSVVTEALSRVTHCKAISSVQNPIL